MEFNSGFKGLICMQIYYTEMYHVRCCFVSRLLFSVFLFIVIIKITSCIFWRLVLLRWQCSGFWRRVVSVLFDMVLRWNIPSKICAYRFAINGGRVTYQSRFLKTQTYKRNMAAQRIVVTEFGTRSVPDPCQTIFQRYLTVL